MRPLPIRAKLTAWYFAVLAVTFVLFGAVAFFTMQKSIETTIDENLRDRATDVQELMKRVAREGQERLADEFREHAELQEEGNLLQVAGPDCKWLYRSKLMKRYSVPLKNSVGPVFYGLTVDHLPLRILSTQARVANQNYIVQVATLMDDYQEALDNFKWILVFLIPILLLLASVGGYWMSRRALRPVDEITGAAQSITSKNLSSRLAVPQSHDELQRLSETLNSMLERLEGAFKRITQFTADASHELRTPVALMRTTAELSLRKPRPEGEYRDALSQILKELERTSTLIEKLMLLARADSGIEALQFTRVDLVEGLRESCRQGRTLADAKHVNFQEQTDGGPIYTEGDPHSLERLFLILIDNAVKYTPLGGQVSASLGVSDGFAIIEIRDTGIGIAEDDLPHIFERFYRADKARSRDSGGAGLGLAIGRWIAEAHGGTIQVESASGQGSVFRVRLPISRK
jgi:two-component system, OmpR family, heavy metal sensor histidine kinase CusS